MKLIQLTDAIPYKNDEGKLIFSKLFIMKTNFMNCFVTMEVTDLARFGHKNELATMIHIVNSNERVYVKETPDEIVKLLESV